MRRRQRHIRRILEPASARWRTWRARQSRIGRISFWLSAILVVSLVLRRAPGGLHGLAIAAMVFSIMGLAPLLPILVYRWFTRRVLWKVRNRLILSYLLMGLAPVVLFGTLTLIAAYIFAGQYATNVALSMLDNASTEVRDESVAEALFRPLPTPRTPDTAVGRGSKPAAWSGVPAAVLRNGVWRPALIPAGSDPEQVMPFAGQASPAWLQAPFRGLVELKGQLYLCSVSSVPQGGQSVLVLGSLPVDAATLAHMADRLGRITVVPGFTRLGEDSRAVGAQEPPGVPRGDAETESFTTVAGGQVPPRSHVWDTPVLFTAPVSITSWQTGRPVGALVLVTSRPKLLYAHLFSTSTNIGVAVRAGLIAIAILFAMLELLAVLMAVGLSRTITRSVADLYRGTQEIDAGNLNHRVRVAHRDQLGALANSFNGMAASIGDLLVQQREQERLLNELAIAQEVQTTLFPKSPASVPGLEMHAVCLPARTVGGDYFDFIFESGPHLCLALGDISGKGISAALLMASLHSAVRAFSLGCGPGEAAQPSPALLLRLINEHLYQSTQSARYATLFFACYDRESRRLTYANGGHLAPLVLSSDGSVQRLDCGGSVVGLLDGLEYVEATVQLQKGDLLMAFTDGLTEPENETGEFGEQRLLACVQKHREEPLPVIISNTMKTLQEWIGGQEQPDDMTLLLARQI